MSRRFKKLCRYYFDLKISNLIPNALKKSLTRPKGGAPRFRLENSVTSEDKRLLFLLPENSSL
jgi:hypothetical protein